MLTTQGYGTRGGFSSQGYGVDLRPLAGEVPVPDRVATAVTTRTAAALASRTAAPAADRQARGEVDRG